MKIKDIVETVMGFLGKSGKTRRKGSLLSQQISSQGYRSHHATGRLPKKRFIEKILAKRREYGQTVSIFRSRKEGTGKAKQIQVPAALLILVMLGYGLMQSPFRSVIEGGRTFRINEVQISGCVMTTANELRKFADISYELNMLTLDQGQIKRRLLKHPWIASAELRRIWPDRLAVTVTEYRPVALVSSSDGEGGGLSYMNRQGTVFAKVIPGQELDFPVITGLDDFGTEVDKKAVLTAVSRFLKIASHNNPNLPAQNISEIHVDPEGGLTLYLVEQPFPIILGKGNIEKKYSQLREVLEELYRKRRGEAMIENVAYIRMDYQADKVLVAKKNAGKRHG